jgi:anti-sigma B factor antagonist
MRDRPPLDVLIAGGGCAGLEAMFRLQRIARMTASSPAAADRVLPQPAAFAVCVQPDRDVVYVKPVGELDLATAPQLRDELHELVAAGFTHIVIDLRALLFIDCVGVRLLVELNADARRRRWRLSLIQGRECVRRVLELTATVDILPLTAYARSQVA